MKPLLVIWQEALQTFVYSFPFQKLLLGAHGAFLGRFENTPDQDYAVETMRLLVRSATPLPSGEAINAELYSNIIICGILEEL